MNVVMYGVLKRCVSLVIMFLFVVVLKKLYFIRVIILFVIFLIMGCVVVGKICIYFLCIDGGRGGGVLILFEKNLNLLNLDSKMI